MNKKCIGVLLWFLIVGIGVYISFGFPGKLQMLFFPSSPLALFPSVMPFSETAKTYTPTLSKSNAPRTETTSQFSKLHRFITAASVFNLPFSLCRYSSLCSFLYRPSLVCGISVFIGF